MDDFADRTIEEEISDVRMTRPHVVLLGAGASRAALPHGDKSGRAVPLMREVADELSLADLFPDDLKALAATDFEAAYSKLVDQGHAVVDELNELIREYFSRLRLPDEPNRYDYLLLSLRGKDAVFTFNWDPLLVQSHVRLQQEGLLPAQLPQLFFCMGMWLLDFALETASWELQVTPGSVVTPAAGVARHSRRRNFSSRLRRKIIMKTPLLPSSGLPPSTI